MTDHIPSATPDGPSGPKPPPDTSWIQTPEVRNRDEPGGIRDEPGLPWLAYLVPLWAVAGIFAAVTLWPHDDGTGTGDKAGALTVLAVCLLGATVSAVGAVLVGTIRDRR